MSEAGRLKVEYGLVVKNEKMVLLVGIKNLPVQFSHNDVDLEFRAKTVCRNIRWVVE